MVSGKRAANFKNLTSSSTSRRQAPPQAQRACRTRVPHHRESHGGLFSSERVSIYIDGSNFYYGIHTLREGYTDFKFDFDRFIRKSVGKRRLIQVYYYNASLKQKVNPRVFSQQRRFFARLRKIKKFKVVLCRRQLRFGPEGEEFYRIKGDDIHLAIDMLKDAYEDKYDTAILLSGDGDFAPLVRYVKRKGKRVENYHFAENVSRALTKLCDECHIIDKKTANRFFYRSN